LFAYVQSLLFLRTASSAFVSTITATGNAGRPPRSTAPCPTRLFGLRGKRIRRERRRALQDPTPPRIQTPYGPIRLNRPPRLCECCTGRGLVRCDVCEGRGVIRATGHNRKRNPIKADRLVGSQWTSVEVYNGHRHHTVMEVRGSRKNRESWRLRLRNCCGEQNDFWIPVDELRDKMVWRMGWLTLEQIL